MLLPLMTATFLCIYLIKNCWWGWENCRLLPAGSRYFERWYMKWKWNNSFKEASYFTCNLTKIAKEVIYTTNQRGTQMVRLGKIAMDQEWQTSFQYLIMCHLCSVDLHPHHVLCVHVTYKLSTCAVWINSSVSINSSGWINIPLWIAPK